MQRTKLKKVSRGGKKSRSSSSVSSGMEARCSSPSLTTLWIDDLASSKCSWLLVALVGGEDVDRDLLCPARKVDVAGGAEAPRRAAPCENPTGGELGWTTMVGGIYSTVHNAPITPKWQLIFRLDKFKES